MHKQFDHLGVRVVRDQRFLGGFIGDLEAINQFVQGKVKEWTNIITILSEAAQSYPQAAFVTLFKYSICVSNALVLDGGVLRIWLMG